MLQTKHIAAAFALTLAACSGEGGNDAGMLFDVPTLTPEQNLVCLNYQRVLVDGTATFGVTLRNDGKPQLIISDVSITDDTRGHFTLQGPDKMTIESADSAVLQIVYQPKAEGWDIGRVNITSNADNFPDGFEIFTLALARPIMDPDTYDPGAKPPEAVGANGEETCPPIM